MQILIKIGIVVGCVFIPSVCFPDNQCHEFEGLAECYNIRNCRLLSKFLPENPVIIEGGAYKGRDTIKLAQKFPLAHIYVFEPLKTCFPQLVEALNLYPNVEFFNQALDITSGSKMFYVCHGTHGQNPIYEFHSSLLEPTGSSAVHLLGPIETISSVSLVDFCKDHQIDKIDMLWLSTEGNELQILEGAQKLIETVSLVYVRSQLYPTRRSITLFKDLRRFMEMNGFVLLSHFYLKDIQGDALFIKGDHLRK